jgi:hypothetical protein
MAITYLECGVSASSRRFSSGGGFFEARLGNPEAVFQDVEQSVLHRLSLILLFYGV